MQHNVQPSFKQPSAVTQLRVLLFWMTMIGWSHASTFVAASPTVTASEYAQRVDQLVEQNYLKHNITPNPTISDHTFLRRTYLNIIGRIPSYNEAIEFLNSNHPDKRAKLVDRLLASEGYVSDQFNFWADILRVVSRSKTRGGGNAYGDWIKQSIRDNKPYDQFVTELLTAEGYPWENPAVEFYLRDFGMPLDHAANTAQIFLGTRMQCAQCHNHPFDKWTQKQFYHMASYTYGMKTRQPLNQMDFVKELQKRIRQSSLEKSEKATIRKSTRQLLRPLQFKVTQTDLSLKLPDDYQYLDAKPKATIQPLPLFGEAPPPQKAAHRAEAYAAWMTDPINERFTQVIANRMWKKVMGYGLIEPIDNINDFTQASNPKLLETLETIMVDLDYDLKEFQRILYKTQVYQREIYNRDVLPDEAYHFPGPVLQRMSAEQVWDSLLTLTIHDLDSKTGNKNYLKQFENSKRLLEMDAYNIAHMSRDIVQAENKTAQKLKAINQAIKTAKAEGDNDTFNQLNKKRKQLQRQRRKNIEKVTAKYYMEDSSKMSSQANQVDTMSMVTDNNKKHKNYNKQFIRASELQSPMSANHMLREFGQSDRETVDAATQDASIPQVLNLLNGSFHHRLLKQNTVLSKNLAREKNAQKKIDVLFISILGRPATPEEIVLLSPQLDKEPQAAIQRITWSLLNTRQFLFIQ